MSAIGLEQVGSDVDYVLAFGSMDGRAQADAGNLAVAIPYLLPVAEPPARTNCGS